MARKFKKKQSFEDKNPEFVSEVAGMDRNTLKTRLTTLVQGLRETEAAQKSDKDLSEAQGKVKEFKAPYTETKKATKDKLNYVSKLIEEKGGA